MNVESSIHDLIKASETPNGVVTAYLGLLDREHYRNAHYLLTHEDREAVPIKDFTKEWLDEKQPLEGIVERTIQPPTFTKKGVAEISVATLYEDGIIVNDDYTVVREPKGWRIRLGFEETLSLF